MKLRPVYVRGIGAITPLGYNWPSSVRALAKGESAIAPIRHFDVKDFPCTVAAVIPENILAHHFRTRMISPAVDRRLILTQIAAREAWKTADIALFPEKTGIFLGAESGRASFHTILALAHAAGQGTQFDHQQFGLNARPLAAQIDASMVSPAAVTSALAREFQAEGPAETLSLACASSAAAIAEGARAIRLGICDTVICGGVGTDVDPLMLAGFGRVGALSTRGISCPFDLYRDGFVVGEGAAIVVLSNERGNALVEVAGEGRTLDGHHLTAPDPSGKGAIRAIQAALDASHLQQVDYIQAHGTSTPLNDAVEAAALREVFGQQLDQAHVSAVKGALGHWIAGAGALGFLCAVEAIANSTLLPTAGLSKPDPHCPLPHIIGTAIQKSISTALVNSFAFGGANCSLVLRGCT